MTYDTQGKKYLKQHETILRKKAERRSYKWFDDPSMSHILSHRLINAHRANRGFTPNTTVERTGNRRLRKTGPGVTPLSWKLLKCLKVYAQERHWYLTGLGMNTSKESRALRRAGWLHFTIFFVSDCFFHIGEMQRFSLSLTEHVSYRLLSDLLARRLAIFKQQETCTQKWSKSSSSSNLHTDSLVIYRK